MQYLYVSYLNLKSYLLFVTNFSFRLVQRGKKAWEQNCPSVGPFDKCPVRQLFFHTSFWKNSTYSLGFQLFHLDCAFLGQSAQHHCLLCVLASIRKEKKENSFYYLQLPVCLYKV